MLLHIIIIFLKYVFYMYIFQHVKTESARKKLSLFVFILLFILFEIVINKTYIIIFDKQILNKLCFIFT